MEQLKKDIEQSGLLKGFIARKCGLTPQHFSMMLSENATMPEEVLKKIKLILNQAKKIK